MDMTDNRFLYKLDPAAFARDMLNFHPDPWQEKVLRSDSKRMLFCCSRQSGKTSIAGLLAVHRARYYPGSLILLVSPSLRQSSESFRKISEFLDRLSVRPTLIEDNRLSCVLPNHSRIISLPNSEATIRGFSNVTMLILDEASRIEDALYKSCRPMLAISGGRIIAMSTPFGRRGFFYEEWASGANWERTLVRASECPRISEEFLREEMRSLGSWWYSQEYECQFLDPAGALFSTEQLQKSFSKSIKPLFSEEVRRQWPHILQA